MRTNVIPFPLNSSFRQTVQNWNPDAEEVGALPGTEVEVRNRTYGGTIVLRALRYTGSSNLTVLPGSALNVDMSTGQTFSGLNNAIGQFSYPASPFLPAAGVVVTPGDVIWAVIDGLVQVRKTSGSGTAISAGAMVTPSTTAGLYTTGATGGRVVGVAAAAAGDSATTVLVQVGSNWGRAL